MKLAPDEVPQEMVEVALATYLSLAGRSHEEHVTEILRAALATLPSVDALVETIDNAADVLWTTAGFLDGEIADDDSSGRLQVEAARLHYRRLKESATSLRAEGNG
jgi:plasmid stability protein